MNFQTDKNFSGEQDTLFGAFLSLKGRVRASARGRAAVHTCARGDSIEGTRPAKTEAMQ